MGKINVLLMIPPQYHRLTMERDNRVADADGTYLPIGLLYVGTYLKQKLQDQVNLRVVDCTQGHWPQEAIENLLRTFRPDVVGLTTFTPLLLDAKLAIETTKRMLPKCITVIGGPHVTSFQEHSLAWDEIDYAIMGYGEFAFAKLIEALFLGGKLSNVPGLLYRENARITRNARNDTALAINDIPYPDLTLVDYRQYRCAIGTQDAMAVLISSRGCPYQCTFCNSPDKIYRARSMENVIGEVKYVIDLGIREIFFFDDLFNLTNSRVYDFCDLLDKNRIKITWAFKSRVTNADEDLIRTVKSHGCERIHFGIETHTDDSLKELKKGITVAQIRNAVSLCNKFGINSVGSFMINLPGDTLQDIKDRFRFANSLGLDYCQFAVLIAYNHTEIFDRGASLGLWDRDLWLNYIRNPSIDFVAPIWDNQISRDALDRLVTEGTRGFYFRAGYIARRLRKLHSIDELKKYIRGAFNIWRF